MNKKEGVLLSLSLLFLFLGGVTYLLFRPHNLLMFSWLRLLDLEKFFRLQTFNTDSKVICFFVYSLPNGFWLLSAIILIGIIFKDSFKNFLLYSILFFSINLVLEFLQLLQVVPGTFDLIDCFVLLLSLLLGICIYRFIIGGVFDETTKKK